jgi:hypothetical protein
LLAAFHVIGATRKSKSYRDEVSEIGFVDSIEVLFEEGVLRSADFAIETHGLHTAR